MFTLETLSADEAMYHLATYIIVCRKLDQVDAELERLGPMSAAELDGLILRKQELEQRAEETYSWGMVEVLIAFVLGALVLSWLL